MGNHAQRVGGVSTSSATINIRNSTIADNTADFGTQSCPGTCDFWAPGLYLTTNYAVPLVVTLENTILAGNTYGGSAIENDLSALATTTFNTVPAEPVWLNSRSFSRTPLYTPVRVKLLAVGPVMVKSFCGIVIAPVCSEIELHASVDMSTVSPLTVVAAPMTARSEPAPLSLHVLTGQVVAAIAAGAERPSSVTMLKTSGCMRAAERGEETSGPAIGCS